MQSASECNCFAQSHSLQDHKACHCYLNKHSCISNSASSCFRHSPRLKCFAGELSKAQGWLLCAALAGAGLVIVATKFGSLITKLYSFGLFLGTIYSVPPLRLKRFAVAAFMIIATVRGFLLNFGVYHAVRAALGLPFVWSPVITCVTVHGLLNHSKHCCDQIGTCWFCDVFICMLCFQCCTLSTLWVNTTTVSLCSVQNQAQHMCCVIQQPSLLTLHRHQLACLQSSMYACTCKAVR